MFGKKRGWPAPQNWIESKQIIDQILDIMPNKVLFSVKWHKIKNDLNKNPSIIRDNPFFLLFPFDFIK